MVRAVTAPMFAASVRIFFIRSSGLKGLPFSIPIEAKRPSMVGSLPPEGSSWMTLLSISQNCSRQARQSGRDARGIGKLHRRRIGRLGELIDLEVLLYEFDAGLGGTIDDKGAEEKPVAVGARAHDDVARRNLTFVIGRQYEILSAFAPVLAGDTDIGDPAIPEVVHAAEDLGRDFDNERPLLGVEPNEVVDRVVVGREFDGARIDEVFPDDIGLVDRAELADRVAHASLVHDRDGHEIGLQGARAVEVVVDFLDGVSRRVAVVRLSVPIELSILSGTATPGAMGVE
jgi:hypothetical protein